MIGIVDYGSGNIQAIANIYKQLNIAYTVISNPKELKMADRLILPGVGVFDETMRQLNFSGLKNELDDLVLNKKKPILGICVGMQLMANSSEEGKLPGLGWIEGKVKKFDIESFLHKPYLPHMGWNSLKPTVKHPILYDIDFKQGFYFIHSYYFDNQDKNNTLSFSHYGGEFSSAVINENIFGMQFHPEKSHLNGVKLLKNFAKLDLC